MGGQGGQTAPPDTKNREGEQKSGRGKRGKGKKKEGKEEKREKGRKKREKEKRKGKRKRGRKREKGKERKREQKKGEKGERKRGKKGKRKERKCWMGYVRERERDKHLHSRFRQTSDKRLCNCLPNVSSKTSNNPAAMQTLARCLLQTFFNCLF